MLVLFAGIMSGLTLGLMSLGLVELEILQRSGTPKEKHQAGTHSIMYLYIDQFVCIYVCIVFSSLLVLIVIVYVCVID